MSPRCFFSIDGDDLLVDIPCHIFNYIGFVLFLCTTAKSLYDLIVSEIIYRDCPILKWTLRKVFHVLLPIPQAAFCISCIVYNMYCIDLREQKLLNILLTSVGGYILALCFLINALHWAFLTSESESLKSRIFIGGIITIFLLIPLIFEILIILFYSKQQERTEALFFIHFLEIIYNSLVNFFVLVVVFISWAVLHRKLQLFSEIPEIIMLKKQLQRQMCVYLTFFFVRAVTLLILGIMGTLDSSKTPRMLRLVIFFISGCLGDVPLAFSMLYFLRHKKVTTGGGPAEASSPTPMQGAGPQSASSALIGGGKVKGAGHYQYISAGIEDGSPGPNQISNPSDAYQNLPYFHTQQAGVDQSTNSYYIQEGGYQEGGYV